MRIRQLYDECLAQAAYIIGCERTRDAIVIDPERDVDRYVAVAREEGLRLVAAAETHIHADFLSGARELAAAYGARVYLSGEGGEAWRYRWPESAKSGEGARVQLLRDGERFAIGDVELTARHTPGHTPEHLSFLVTDRGAGVAEPVGMLSGDFVFVGDVGRPDLLETAAGIEGAKDGAARDLATSARAFLELEDYLQLWPGHGAGTVCGKALGAMRQSTLGYERRFNPALRLSGTPRFEAYVLADQPSPPLYFGRMKRENRDGPKLLGKLPEPRVITPSEIDAGGIVVDARPTAAFAAGHLPGAISAPFGVPLAAVAGSYVEPGTPITIVVKKDRLDEAVRVLVRIGLDDVVATVRPSEIRSIALAKLPRIDVETLASTLEDTLLLDVRSPEEYARGHLAGAHNVPYARLPAHIDGLPKDRRVVAYCQSGSRSTFAVSLLLRHGYDAANVRGGVDAWVSSGRALEAPETTADRS